MFKPTLKRSQANFFTSISNPSMRDELLFPKQQYFENSQKKINYQTPSMIIPSQLIKEISLPKIKESSHIFNPLVSSFHEYPPSVQQLLKDEQGIKKRGIGVHKNICWLSCENKLILWEEEKMISKQYQTEKVIEAVAIGELKNVGLQFKKRQITVLAMAQSNEVNLYAFNMKDLELTDLRVKYTLDYAFTVQIIKFVNENTFIFGGDARTLHMVSFQQSDKANQQEDFTLKKKSNQFGTIIKVKKPFYQALFPSSHLWSSNQQRYLQEIVIIDSKIYCLVTITRETNWMTKTKKMVDSLRGIYRNKDQYVREQKVIEVYTIDNNKKEISFISSTSQRDIQRKVKSNFRNFDGDRVQDAFQIRSINKHINLNHKQYQTKEFLSVVTKCGYIIVLRNLQEIYFQGEPILIPKCLGETGFFLQKNLNSELYRNTYRYNEVITSLGYDDLTLMSDCLIFYNEQRLSAIKCNNLYGEIIKKACSGRANYQKQWIVFSKEGYYLVNLLEERQILMGYLYLKNQLLEMHGQKQFQYQVQFHQAMLRISKVLGSIKFCQVLLQILAFSKQEHWRVNTLIFNQMIQNDLKKAINKDFSDWTHDLSDRPASKIMGAYYNTILESAWNLLMEHQYKEIVQIQGLNLGFAFKQCTAYWFALQHLFYKNIKPLLELQAKNCKKQVQMINCVLDNLEGIAKMVSDKKSKERAVREELANKIARRSKHYLKKYQEQQNNTLDRTSAHYQITNHIINEPIMQLENYIISAFPKIHIIIRSYFKLMETQTQPIPIFSDVLKYIQAQDIVKDSFMTLFADNQELVQEISNLVPELNLNKEIYVQKWINLQKIERLPSQQFEIAQINEFVTSKYFSSVKAFLKNSLQKYLQVLLVYYDKIKGELTTTMQKNSLYQKNLSLNNIFGNDEIELIEQRKAYLSLEELNVEKQITILIGDIANLFTKQKNLHNQKLLDTFIDILKEFKNQAFLTIFQNQLRNLEQFEKVVRLKKKINSSPYQNKQLNWSEKIEESSRRQQKTVTKKQDHFLFYESQ